MQQDSLVRWMIGGRINAPLDVGARRGTLTVVDQLVARFQSHPRVVPLIDGKPRKKDAAVFDKARLDPSATTAQPG